MSGGNSKPDPYYSKDPPKKTPKKSNVRRGWHHSEETKEKMRQRAQARWEDPEYRKRMSEAYRHRQYTDEGRAKISAKIKKQWEDSEYREKVSTGLKRTMKDPEQRRVRSEKGKEAWADQERRKKQSRRTKERWKDSEYRRKVTEGVRKAVKDPKWIKAHSDALTKRWENSEYRKRQLELMRKGLKERGLIGQRAPHRRRRKQERIYDRIRQRDNHTCRVCRKQDSKGARLHVHHVIPRRMGGPDEDWNLATLCPSCHRKADAQPGNVKLPLGLDGTPAMKRKEILGKWWNYCFGEPT